MKIISFFYLSGCTEDDLLKNETTDIKNNPMTRTMAYITIFNFVKLGEIYGKNSGLNLMEKADLEKVLEELAYQPQEYRQIFELFVQNKIKIDFMIDPNINDPALYDKNTKSIKFRSKEEICWYNISEELLHAAQHLIFYGDVMDMAYKNYEFEAKVFYDLAYGLAPTGLDDPPFTYTNYLPTYSDERASFRSEYKIWMDNLLNLHYSYYSVVVLI